MRALSVFAALVAAAHSAPGQAALAPNYQRLVELRAVLHLDLAALLGQTPVDGVTYVRPDLYRVSAGRCRLDVRIVDLPTPPNIVGARRFEARPGRPVCGR